MCYRHNLSDFSVLSIVLYLSTNQMFMKFSHINVLCGLGWKIGLVFRFHLTVCETVSTVLMHVYCLWRVSIVSILRPPIPRHSDWAGWAAHAEPSGTKGRLVNKEGSYLCETGWGCKLTFNNYWNKQLRNPPKNNPKPSCIFCIKKKNSTPMIIIDESIHYLNYY